MSKLAGRPVWCRSVGQPEEVLSSCVDVVLLDIIMIIDVILTSIAMCTILS